MLIKQIKNMLGLKERQSAARDDSMPSYVPPKRPGQVAGPAVSDDQMRQQEIQAWAKKLPEEVRPRELIKAYPRIAFKIAFLWSKPAEFDQYMNELLIDKRGDRAGFPPAVANELVGLNVFYTERYGHLINPADPNSPWRG
jgi:hypothetical protein